MKRVMRIVVLGSKRAGKTAFLQQLAKFQDPLDQVTGVVVRIGIYIYLCNFGFNFSPTSPP